MLEGDIFPETEPAGEIIDSLKNEELQELMVDVKDVLQIPEMQPFTTYLSVLW